MDSSNGQETSTDEKVPDVRSDAQYKYHKVYTCERPQNCTLDLKIHCWWYKSA